MHIISTETCQNKKKKQKNNTEKTDIENWKKIQTKRVFFFLLYSIKMSYYWLNRENILKNARYKSHNKGGKYKLLNIMLKIKKRKYKK